MLAIVVLDLVNHVEGLFHCLGQLLRITHLFESTNILHSNVDWPLTMSHYFSTVVILLFEQGVLDLSDWKSSKIWKSTGFLRFTILLNLICILCIVLDIFLCRESLALLASTPHINLLSLIEQLINLVALDELAHSCEVRVSEITSVFLIEELEALVNVLLSHCCSHPFGTFPELILGYSASLFVVYEQSIHARQRLLLLAHPLPEVDETAGNFGASRIIVLFLDADNVRCLRAPETIHLVPLHVSLLVARNWVIVVGVRIGKGLVQHGAGGLEYIH